MRILFLGTEMGETMIAHIYRMLLCPRACTKNLYVHSLIQSFLQLLEFSTVMISILQMRKP